MSKFIIEVFFFPIKSVFELEKKYGVIKSEHTDSV